MSEAVKVSSGAFKSLLGMDATKHADPKEQPDNISFIRRFSKAEAKSYINELHVKPEVTSSDYSPAAIISYLKPIHQEVGNKRLDADKMRALAPEIEQSRILVSSSIMSPNDLQDGEFTFKFEDVPGLEADEDLTREITEVYDLMFNKTLQLGIKSYDWIGDIQYSSGCKPILILPIATQIDVKNHTVYDIKDKDKLMLGFASFDDYVKHDKDTYLYSEKVCTWKDVLSNTDEKSMYTSMLPSMESFGIELPNMKPGERKTTNKFNIEEFESGMEGMIVNLRKKLEEGDVIKISENPEILKFATKKKYDDKYQLYEKLQKKLQKDLQREEIVILKANPHGIPHQGHPTLIELPPESVIPIHVPGAPKEHIGYFVLIDGYGQPLTIENSNMMDTSTTCKAGSSAAAYEAMFGSGCTQCACFNGLGGDRRMEAAGNMIFTHMFEAYLKARLKGIFNREDLTLSRFNAIATTLFYRVLDRKETTLLFVPTTLLHYLAFDYDKQTGVGTSKLDEIKFILSLRTTLLMANCIAMANDAVEHKKIEFGVDEKVANLEGVMDLLANIFIAKNKINGSIDPSEILNDLYSNALTIVPKGIPGLQDLTVDVSSSGGQSTRVDDQLIEKLNELLVSHLDVPPSALNSMNEPEFAKSLVTYNLFFAKKIARYQRIWCNLIGNLIRTYSTFDIPFQHALLKKLEAAGKKKDREQFGPKVEELKKQNPNKYKRDHTSMLKAIMENVTVSLATPNIVVDRTQYDEVKEFMMNVEDMSQQLFNQELVPQDDQAAMNALPIMRAKWKRDQMLRFLVFSSIHSKARSP